MSASDHIHPKLFMQAKELMGLGSLEAEDESIPFSEAIQNREYKGLSHAPKANSMSKLVNIKRAENELPHDESMFGTDVKNINEGETLPESIKRKGIVNPVVLTASEKNKKKWVIQDGQHRIVAAHDINPDMFVPTTYEW